MARTSTGITNIGLDWFGGTEPRTDMKQQDWEKGVLRVLHELNDLPPNKTSRAVLDGLRQAKKSVTIVPERQPFLPGKADANAHADPTNPAGATRRGGKTEDGRAAAGTGRGSDVILAFTAQDWTPSNAAASLKARDETLLHELLHALRQVRGLEDSVPVVAPFPVMRKGDASTSQLMTGGGGPQGPHSQIYNEYEEFLAIVITNIYRSENRRIGLRRDHLGGDAALSYPLTNARIFASVWQPQLHRLCKEMPAMCKRIAGVACDFNPIFELYTAENRYPPGAARDNPR